MAEDANVLLEEEVNNSEHPLVNMRDAETAFSILTCDTEREVSLCICCRKHQLPMCPHKGKEKVGICPNYLLDERDPHQTELRVMAFLQGHPHS